MANQKILLPHNFADYDHRAMDFVIRTFANQRGVDITLFNSYTPLPEIAIHETPVLDKLKGNMNFLSQQIKEQENAIKEAMQQLVQNGFSEKQVRYIFRARRKDTAGEIIDLALSEHFDLIIINHKPGKIKKFFTGSVFNKVVDALKETAVCVVT
jgi:uncharacterized protein (UPF0335 family)